MEGSDIARGEKGLWAAEISVSARPNISQEA
jgi:hypothetical protein